MLRLNGSVDFFDYGFDIKLIISNNIRTLSYKSEQKDSSYILVYNLKLPIIVTVCFGLTAAVPAVSTTTNKDNIGYTKSCR